MSTDANHLQPSPYSALGAFFDGRGVHFAVFSENAESVELCLFDGSGRHERRLKMPECADGVWHGYLPGATAGQLYGYRAHGPYEPKRGLRFNPHKLLLDPYARQLAGELRWHDALHGYRIGSPRADLVPDRRDSAAYLPKAVVTYDNFDWGDDRPPRVPWSETVIYEMHVKGFSKLREEILPHDRGTFGALGHRSSVDYLRGLGITAVELLPIHAFARDRHLVERGLTNYWGYNTLSYFAPDPAYLSDGTLGQVKWAIQQLHAAGIEVILDVVYNHTGEGSELGPTLCWRGLDNSSYYNLLDDEPRYYINDTGCGNTLNFGNRRVIQMVMDSLRYWVREFHVDGFRFDLGVTLGRESYGFDPNAGFFDALLQDPELARVKLISEPWDIGPGGYQVGNHPPRFAEWNGLFRDDARRYWRGDEGLRGALAQRLQGSAELFDHNWRRPWASVNFITAHDGFTLRDLVSYEDKHNEANGEENRDGADDNYSCNWGCEGETDDDAIDDLRRRLMRSLQATLIAAGGTPMLLAGDEFGQTQHGNNNAYCQDNELSWLDWSLLAQEPWRRQRDFVARLIALRKRHPLLREAHYREGDDPVAEGLTALLWFDERGVALDADHWHNPTARLLGLRRARRDNGRVEVLMLLVNGDSAGHRFRLPAPRIGYRVLLRTDEPAAPEQPLDQPLLEVPPYTFVILAAETDDAQLRDAAALAEQAKEEETEQEPADTAGEAPAETGQADADEHEEPAAEPQPS